MIKAVIGKIVFIIITNIIIIFAGGGVDFINTAVGKCYLILWTLWWTLSLIGRQSGVQSSYDNRQKYAVKLFSIISVPILVIAPPFEYSRFAALVPREGFLTWMGFGFFLMGVALQALVMWQLRGFFTVRLGIQPEHKLVTTGVYRFVRHPGYTSYILSILGIGFMLSSAITISLSIFITLFLMWRIKHEEKMLLNQFGEEYRIYIKSTKKLIPFIF
jgi:protein-S-isoprenylcysteine O-methyltransferase Ste14